MIPIHYWCGTPGFYNPLLAPSIHRTKKKPVLGLRIGVTNTGCSGHMYQVEYAEEERPLEEMVEQDGIRIFIDPLALMFVFGSKLDYVEDKLQSGFVFENPNETSRCGCGESFAV